MWRQSAARTRAAEASAAAAPLVLLVLALLSPTVRAEFIGKAYHQGVDGKEGVWLNVKDQGAAGHVPPLPLDLAGEEEGSRIGGQDRSNIFVEISAYRDDLCGITLRELFTHAAHPERIWVGIVDQTKGGDTPCVEQYCKLMQQPQDHLPTFQSGGLRYSAHRGVHLHGNVAEW